MSKPISFGFNKTKIQSSTLSSSNLSNRKPKTSGTTEISIPKFSVATKKAISHSRPNPRTALSAINDDHDHDDEEIPPHEEVTGFSTDGAILTRPEEENVALVIENSGNQDWRQSSKRRKGGQDLLPQEVRAARDGQDVVMVEKDMVSTASGLQFASTTNTDTDMIPADVVTTGATSNGSAINGFITIVLKSTSEQNGAVDDEVALAALLSDNPNTPRSNAIIDVGTNIHNETDDFRADVASRPDPSTLEEYAAMPVEEFGLAMLRGMGRKRRANGEVIAMPDFSEKKDKDVEVRKQEGFLGIGAKAVTGPGLEGVELGAWGKADMRKNAKGEGFFTPLMVRDTKTGEVVTEEEMERRKKAKREGEREGELEWKERRERNLERYGRDRGEGNGSRRGGRDGDRDGGSGSDSARSRSHRDRNGDDYDSERSRRRSRSRSRDRRRRDDNEDEECDSRSSRKSKSDGRDRNRDRDKNRDSERDRRRDKYDDRSDRRDRDDRRRRDEDRDKDRGRDRR